MFGSRRDMFGIFATMQDAAMNLGMERFDASIQHFGEAREIGNVFDGDSRIAQEFRGSPG